MLFYRLFEELKGQHETEKTKLLGECDTLRNRLQECDDRCRKDKEISDTVKTSLREKNEEIE